MPHVIERACRVGLKPGEKPAECVLDYGNPDLCLYAGEIGRREQCHWWQEIEITSDNEPRVQSRESASPSQCGRRKAEE